MDELVALVESVLTDGKGIASVTRIGSTELGVELDSGALVLVEFVEQ